MSTISGVVFDGRPTPAMPAPAATINEATSSTSLDTPVEINQRETAPFGIVTHTSDAHLGDSPAAKGAPVYSGDPLSTGPGGALTVIVGTLAVKLEGDSTARIYRASYASGSLQSKDPKPHWPIVIIGGLKNAPDSVRQDLEFFSRPIILSVIVRGFLLMRKPIPAHTSSGLVASPQVTIPRS